MILELLRNSSESDFLAWRFDIFIFPMVNQDGVQLGNYRSNFAGFDLNRCWLRPDSVKHPEVIAIKNYIKKLQKKYKIELVLDLHGHSRK
jgi:murein tripeptide amidase MpaA